MPLNKLYGGVFIILMFVGSSLKGQSVFINEINYLISNPDQGIEVAGPAGQDLAGWQIVIYGITGLVTTSRALNGVIPNQQNGYGAIWYDVEQGFVGNGAALINPSNEVVQFISYGLNALGGNLVVLAQDGIAAGLTSTFIGIIQVLPINSLQLTGTGNTYADFVWSIPLGITESAVNTAQFFSSSLLPVELIHFEARKIGVEVKIEWATESEINLDYFQLERSHDGRNFYPIYYTEGLGTDEGPRTYSFIDKRPESPTSYYRLKNIDLDGSTGVSEIVAVNFRKTGIKQLYIIPGTQRLVIQLYEENNTESGHIAIFDINGRVLGEYKIEPGLKTQEIDLTPLTSGAYFIKINLWGQVYSRLVINHY